MRWVASVCVLLAACGPVLLRAEQQPSPGGAPPIQQLDAGAAGSAGGIAIGPAEPPALGDTTPRALINSVKSLDCGRCFELVATGSGGVPPYNYEWDDGSQDARRRVCVDPGTIVSLTVLDATAARSPLTVTFLESDADGGCPPPPPPQPPAKLCVMNASFEGVPAINIGVPETFDAAPWSACVNPSAAAAGAVNMPDIGSDASGFGVTQAPKPTEGNTFLALAEGEQVSQKLCEAVQTGTELYMQIDLLRANVTTGGMPGNEALFFEIWGGSAVDCSQRQLLWTSPALATGWKNYCVKLKARELMDQITLRANSDMPLSGSAYLIVDALVPVDDCP